MTKRNNKENAHEEDKGPMDSVENKFYTTRRRKEQINKYMELTGRTNFSAFIRLCITMYMEVINPIDREGRELQLWERIKNIETTIKEISEKRSTIQEQISSKREEQATITLRRKTLRDQIPSEALTDIPNYEEIKGRIVELIEAMPEKEIKEFVLMQKLKEEFDEKNIWLTLFKLQKLEKLVFNMNEGVLSI
jgi:regulator of replication initiation timing